MAEGWAARDARGGRWYAMDGRQRARRGGGMGKASDGFMVLAQTVALKFLGIGRKEVDLFHAVIFGKLGEAGRLLARGADARKVVAGTRDPVLALAAMGGSVEMVRLLLPHSDPLKAGVDGMTALMHAARSGSAGVVGVLLPASDPSARDPSGWTALTWAANAGAAACVAALMGASDVDARCVHGRTALMHGILRPEVVDLLAPVSDLSLADVDGVDALGLAKVLAAEMHDPSDALYAVGRIESWLEMRALAKAAGEAPPGPGRRLGL